MKNGAVHDRRPNLGMGDKASGIRTDRVGLACWKALDARQRTLEAKALFAGGSTLPPPGTAARTNGRRRRCRVVFGQSEWRGRMRPLRRPVRVIRRWVC